MMLYDTVVSDRQIRIHKLTEAASLYLQTPFMIYLAAKKSLPVWARVTSAMLAIAVIFVDGGFLAQWKAKASGQPGPFGST